MIVFTYSPHGISVIRTFEGTDTIKIFGPYKDGREAIGRLRLSDEWLWDARRVSLDIYRTLSHSEKRQIIGMLDALNQKPIRPITQMKARWEEIIGPMAVAYMETYN